MTTRQNNKNIKRRKDKKNDHNDKKIKDKDRLES